jgi:site-specific DNA-methyltransferase (cytosine-N4-specific)
MAKRAPKASQDIPSGQNFSPSEVGLPRVLELVYENQGNRKALSEAIRSEYYADRPQPKKGQGTVWQNVTSGMVAYGLIDETARFTDFGWRLYKLRADEQGLYRELAKHLLLNVSGVALIECLQDMQRAGEDPNLPTIREALEERGFHTATAGKSISLLRLWLDKAGLFRSQWIPNTKVYHELLGRSEEEISALAGLTGGQKAVLRMLASLGPGHYDSSDLRKSTEKAFGVRLNEKQFPKDVLYRLRELGYVQLTRKGGRGWTLDVQPTESVDAKVTVPLLEQLSGLDPTLRSLIRMSVSDIVGKLDSDKHQKGLALEALGFKLMRIVGLEYMDTRFRPQPGRFEVDLLFDSDRLAYSRWQIQCKNTDRVSVDDVAKEVGLTYYLLSNVIVMLTRGIIGIDARRYSSDVMRKTNLAIVLIDGSDTAEIVANPLAIFDVLEREAANALELKPLDIAATTATSRPDPCTNCGGSVGRDDKFCPHCGTPAGTIGAAPALNGGTPGTPSLF